jgi:hypothetical protein
VGDSWSDTSPAAAVDAMSIAEFCRRHSLSEPFYYKLQRQGRGPQTIRLGARTLITVEAAARWRRALERKQASENAEAGFPGRIWIAKRPTMLQIGGPRLAGIVQRLLPVVREASPRSG